LGASCLRCPFLATSLARQHISGHLVPVYMLTSLREYHAPRFRANYVSSAYFAIKKSRSRHAQLTSFSGLRRLKFSCRYATVSQVRLNNIAILDCHNTYVVNTDVDSVTNNFHYFVCALYVVNRFTLLSQASGTGH